MKRLIRHARRFPRGFRYTRRGLLVQRERPIQEQAEEIVLRLDDVLPDGEVRGWNGAGADVEAQRG